MGEIQLANLSHVDEIMQFIHVHWKENHILAKNKDFFMYEYCDSEKINFVISRNESDRIDGILGFIKPSYSTEFSDYWAAIWKTIKGASPMLGVRLLEYLRKLKGNKALICSGINVKTLGIYNFLDIYNNHLNHFVILNDKMKNFSIALVRDTKISQSVPFLNPHSKVIKKIGKDEFIFDFARFGRGIPHKDKEYLIKRFFEHPIYLYDVYGIVENNELCSLLVTRLVTANGSQALRVVDFVGEEENLKFFTPFLYDTIVANNLEYIDFMCYGFKEASLVNAGFNQLDLDSNQLIIPNYFSPFVRENKKIYFFIDSENRDKVKICKADGDQDRPS